MKLWIDGDSCPREAMEIALKAHQAGRLEVRVVADREIPGVRECGAGMVLIPHGSGLADSEIINKSESGDLAVTRDYRLGLLLLNRGVKVLSDRGRIRGVQELKSRIEEAELMKAMRNGGVSGKAVRYYSKQDARDFGAALSRLLSGV